MDQGKKTPVQNEVKAGLPPGGAGQSYPFCFGNVQFDYSHKYFLIMCCSHRIAAGE